MSKSCAAEKSFINSCILMETIHLFCWWLLLMYNTPLYLFKNPFCCNVCLLSKDKGLTQSMWWTSQSPWDSNSHLCSPQSQLTPFTGSPGKDLTLLVNRHWMAPTTRHHCDLLSVQSSYKLYGEEEDTVLSDLSWLYYIKYTLSIPMNLHSDSR